MIFASKPIVVETQLSCSFAPVFTAGKFPSWLPSATKVIYLSVISDSDPNSMNSFLLPQRDESRERHMFYSKHGTPDPRFIFGRRSDTKKVRRFFNTGEASASYCKYFLTYCLLIFNLFGIPAQDQLVF